MILSVPERQNPDFPARQARKLYEKRVDSRRWVDKRLGRAKARQEWKTARSLMTRGTTELAEKAKDMHNPPLPHKVRTVA